MRSEEEVREMVLSYIKEDKLYRVIKDTPHEQILFSDEYLKTIVEKRLYPLADIAEWFNTSDGSLRYYLKPFEVYIFQDDGIVSGQTNNVLRLSVQSVLRLRMLNLLRKEYRVKGLKQLLGLDGEGYVTKAAPISSSREVGSFGNEDHDEKFEELQDQIETMANMLSGIMKSGLFTVSTEGDKTQIVLNEQIQLITQNVEQAETLKLELSNKENELKKMEDETREKYLSVSAKLNKLELTQKYRLEALKLWKERNKYGVWAKLTKSDQIELERTQFIDDYVNTRLKEVIKSENKLEETEE